MRNPNCIACDLHKKVTTVCLYGAGPVDAAIMFIGSEPDGNDDILGKPFSGKGGFKFDSLLSVGKIDRKKVYITNVVKCKPPNRKPTKIEKSACVQYLRAEIKTINPKMIVVMGADALEVITGQDKIMRMAGSVINVNKEDWGWEGKVYVTVKPSYLDRNPGYMPRAHKHFTDIGYYFRGEEPPRAQTNYTYLTDFDRIDGFFNQLEKQKLVAFDTETSSLNFRTGKLLCFSFSWKENTGIVLPLLLQDYAPLWDSSQLDHILSRLKQAFANPDIAWIAHNMSFDHKYVMALGQQYKACQGIDIVGTLHDTMLLQHLLDENAMDLKGLKELANTHTDMGRYDDELDNFKAALKKEKSKIKTSAKREIQAKLKMVQSLIDQDPDDLTAFEDRAELMHDLDFVDDTRKAIDISYAEIPTDLLWPYAAMDADATLRIFNHHYKELKRQSIIYNKYQDPSRKQLTLHRLYVSLVMKLRRVLDEMEFIGAEINIPYLEKLDVKYAGQIDVLTKKFNALPQVSQVEDHLYAQSIQKSSEKWGELKSVQTWQNYKKLDAAGMWSDLENPPRPPKFLNVLDYGKHYGKRVVFNMNSPAHLRVLLYDILMAPRLHAKTTKAGALSTDKEVLEANDQLPGVKLLLENRALVKLHNTYVVGILTKLRAEGHNRVHTNFNQHVTVTGRLSSSQPNLQNIPRENKDIKRAFRSSKPGWQILQMDYAQAEFRMWAQLSEDRDMITDIHNGLDIHVQTACDFWNIPLAEFEAGLNSSDPAIKKRYKSKRSAAKFVVFGLMYGRGAASVAKQVGITKEEAEAIKKMFFDRYPKAANWLVRTKKNAERMLFVPGFFGRIRRLPYASSLDQEKAAEAKRQAVNAPIQGSAADVCGIALIRIREKFHSLGLIPYAHILLTVHDSIILEVAPEKLNEVVEICRAAMVENIPCMTVRMESDVEIGDNWADLQSWDDYLRAGVVNV